MLADQAQRLREMAAAYKRELAAPPRAARVLAVTSGKGGVGKSNVSVNLACALCSLGRQVLLMDADLGLANADILLGTVPPFHLGHFVRGECGLEDLLHEVQGGVRLVAGGSGISELVDLPPARVESFVTGLRRLEALADFLILDTGAGLGAQVIPFLLAADEVILVSTPEPTAMADAYAIVKTLVRRSPGVVIKLLVNQVVRPAEGEEAALRLTATARRFLGAAVETLGCIPWDPEVGVAVRRQTPFVLGAPGAPASRALAGVARRIAGVAGDPPRGNRFFDRVRRLLGG